MFIRVYPWFLTLRVASKTGAPKGGWGRDFGKEDFFIFSAIGSILGFPARSARNPIDSLEKNLTEGNPIRLIVLFAIPLLLGNFFQQTYNAVDLFIVGRTLGPHALAAVGCTGSVLFFVIGFIHASAAGFAIVTAQRYGAQDEAGIRKSFCTTLVCGAMMGGLLTLFGVLYTEEILTLLRTPPEIFQDAYRYLVVILAGLYVSVLFNVLSSTILALGNSKTPLFFLAIACTLNIFMDYLFIVHFKWGVAGAAYATVLAQLLSGLFCLVYVYRNLKFLLPRREDWRLSLQELWGSLRIGLPMGFQANIIALGCIIVQMRLNELGPLAVAAFSTANKVDLLAIMPMMSFGIAMATYVGQNYGAGKIQRIRQGVRQCSVLSLGVSVVVAGVNISFGHHMVGLFVGSAQPEILELARMYLAINASMYWVLSLLFVYRYTLQGLGRSFVPTVAGIMELVMRVLAAVFLAVPLGFGGVALASPLAWIGAAVPLMGAYYILIHKLGKNEQLSESVQYLEAPPELPTAYPGAAAPQQ